MGVSSISGVDAAAIRNWYQEYLAPQKGGTAATPEPTPAPAPVAALPTVSVSTPLTPRISVDVVGAARKMAMGAADAAGATTQATVTLFSLREAAMASAAGPAAGRSMMSELAGPAAMEIAAPAAADQRSRAEIIAQASYGIVADAGGQDQVKALLRSA